MTVRYRMVSIKGGARNQPTRSETHETPGCRAHLAAMADPRAHAGLPGRGRVGAADAGRPRRLPPAGAEVLLRRRVARRLPRRPRALGDAMEARAAARLGRPGRRPGFSGADAPRPAAGGPARRPVRPRPPRPPLHAALPARRRVC